MLTLTAFKALHLQYKSLPVTSHYSLVFKAISVDVWLDSSQMLSSLSISCQSICSINSTLSVLT